MDERGIVLYKGEFMAAKSAADQKSSKGQAAAFGQSSKSSDQLLVYCWISAAFLDAGQELGDYHRRVSMGILKCGRFNHPDHLVDLLDLGQFRRVF